MDFCPDCLLTAEHNCSHCWMGNDPQGQRILLNVAGSSVELDEGLERLKSEGASADDLTRVRRVALGLPESIEFRTARTGYAREEGATTAEGTVTTTNNP